MATARNVKTKPKPSAPHSVAELATPAPLHPILRAFDEVYRFLSSVKLAVICIFTLAMVLAGATIFESGYGIPASREYVYQNKAFAILLAFLAANIFCAATIRFPWKKRQVGFVVTHIGLLVILAGAFVSLSASDEGQLGMPEGTTSSELVRIDHSVVRVEKLDPASGKWGDSYVLPLDHGAFSWNSDELAPLSKDAGYQTKVWLIRSAFGAGVAALLIFVFVWAVRRPAGLGLVRGALVASVLIGLNAGLGVVVMMIHSGPRRDVLTDAQDPFQFVVKDYLASSGREEMRADLDPTGYTAVRLSLPVKPPGSAAMNALDGRDWFAASASSFERTFRDGQPAAVSYQLARGPHAANIVDDFLHPPASPLTDTAARIHYLDDAQKPRVYEWVMGEGDLKKTITLPGSDLKVTLEASGTLGSDSELGAELLGFGGSASGRDRAAEAVSQATGGTDLQGAYFNIGRGSAAPEKYFAISSLSNLPAARKKIPGDPIVSIGFYAPPNLTAKGAGMAGRLAQIEVLQTEDATFYARGFGRDGLMGQPGPITVGQSKPLIASAKMPMQIAIRVDEVLPKARIRKVFVPVELARQDREKAVPAVQAEMTVNRVTRPLSLIRLPDIRASEWETVKFPDATYRVAFDFDRMTLPFTLGLTQFDAGTDPGSPTPATFRSEVTVTDPELDFKNEKRSIFMNNPLTHRGWTFYQSSYNRVKDPETGQPEGAYASFFQVHYDPAWKIIYSGCLLLVIGVLLQFTMRAGLFSDGVKRERALAAAKAEKARADALGVSPRIAPAEHVATNPGESADDF